MTGWMLGIEPLCRFGQTEPEHVLGILSRYQHEEAVSFSIVGCDQRAER